MLQGMGHTNLPMLHMLAGIVAKLIAVCQLTNAEYGIAGAAWATNINFGVTAALNILALQYFKIKFHWLSICKIILAALIMGAAAQALHGLLAGFNYTLATLAALVGAGVVYAALLPLLRIISVAELKQLPLVKKLAQKLRK